MVILSSQQDGCVVELHHIKYKILTCPISVSVFCIQRYKFPSNLLCPDLRLDCTIKKSRKVPLKSFTYSSVMIVAQLPNFYSGSCRIDGSLLRAGQWLALDLCKREQSYSSHSERKSHLREE